MPFDASSVFKRLFKWRDDCDAGIKIRADRMDQEMDGIVGGINNILQGDVNFKGAIKGVYGTNAAPAFSFEEDPNTGFYRSGADKLAASAGGTKVLELRQDEVEALANFKKGTFAIDGNFVSFEGGNHWITYNESGHDFGLRAGNKRSGSKDVITSNGHGAVAVSVNHKAADPAFKVRISNSGALGSTVTWVKELVAKASGALTWGGHTIWHEGNLDPLRSDANNTMTGRLDLAHDSSLQARIGYGTGGDRNTRIEIYDGQTTRRGSLERRLVDDVETISLSRYGGARLDLKASGRAEINGHLVHHAGNGGSGSNFDSDKLDGAEGAHYLDVANFTGLNAERVGTYAFAQQDISQTANVDFGEIVSGYYLHPANAQGTRDDSERLSGTWRCMGHKRSSVISSRTTLWLRIA